MGRRFVMVTGATLFALSFFAPAAQAVDDQNPRTTLRIYSHVSDDADRAVTKRLDAMFSELDGTLTARKDDDAADAGL